jgi:hypothetical protein
MVVRGGDDLAGFGEALHGAGELFGVGYVYGGHGGRLSYRATKTSHDGGMENFSSPVISGSSSGSRAMSKQSPIRRLRRDRSRLAQELQLAQGTDDKAAIPILQKKIRDLDAEIAALEAKQAD